MYEYQKEAFLFGIQKEKAGILLDMGLGKTLVAINIMRYHLQFNNANKILIVCPSSVLYNWEDAIKTSSEYDFLIISDNIRENRNHKFQNSNCKFNIINYESLFPALRDANIMKKEKKKRRGDGKVIKKMTYNAKYRKLINNLGYDCLIFDESSKYLKTHDTNTTRASVLLADQAKYKLLLTGTLIGNKPLELFPQFRILTNGQIFGNNFYEFRTKYFYKSGYHWKLKPKAVYTFRKVIYSYCIRKTREECLPELPGMITNKILINFNDMEWREYRKVRQKVVNEIETELGKTKINITNIFTQLIRLQQMTSGFTKDETKDRFVRLSSTPKLNALLEQLDILLDNEEVAIIWCRYRFSIQTIAEELKKKKIQHIIMNGDDNAKIKYKKWKKYQESNIPIFLGQVESGGFGIELFKKELEEDKQQHMISYEYTWALDVREQAKARVVRKGQRNVCIYTDLIVKDTIDERILNTVRQNKKISELIMQKGANIV